MGERQPFKRSFMQPVVIFGDWWKIETDRDGTVVLPAMLFDLDDVMREYPETFLEGIEKVENKYGARMSAAGYMDCTDWTIHDSEKEGYDYLAEMYGDEDDEDEDAD